MEQALQTLELLDSDESAVAIRQQLQQEQSSLSVAQHKAAFAGLQVFDKLTVHNELNTYGPVSINSVDQQPALSVNGQAMIDNLIVGTASIQNITIPGDLTVNSLTANTIIDAGAAGNVGQVFTVGAGGKLSPSSSTSGLQTIIGDSGSATQVGGNITFTGLPAGKTVTFSGTAATISLNSTDANNNTTIGKSAGAALTSGIQNTALGAFALNSNTTGILNTAIGYQAMLTNSLGGQNVALGVQTLKANTSGGDNIAIGYNSLSKNTTGFENVAIGTGSLLDNVTGATNVAIGYNSLVDNAADGNVGIGYRSLFFNFTGTNNTALGTSALSNGVNSSGINNIALGYNAGATLQTGSNNIYIGHQGSPTESGVIRVGSPSVHTAFYAAGVSGATSTSGVAVLVNSAGKLGTTTSSKKYKDDIVPLHDPSDRLMNLEPVQFVYKTDESKTKQYGLIAEDVDVVYPELVVRDAQGEIWTVRYDQLHALLLKGWQEQQAKIIAQQQQIDAHHALHTLAIEELQTQIAMLRAAIQLNT
ncbi:MAG: tail fiber domain-containing protein [Candidatus Dependentiae bacterium]|nr:tail fiber domain-containing protein [Candidatus Dependentiae bacterium]